MICPNCGEQKLVILKKGKEKGYFYHECPTIGCYCILVKIVKVMK